jgi:hypothetical protein
LKLIASAADKTVQFMHQTAREFLIRIIPKAELLKFEISDIVNKAIATMWVRYLMLCFTSPSMQDKFSKIESWSLEDFRAYAEYLNEWPSIEYSLRFISDHHDLCDRPEEVSHLVTRLIRQLSDDQTSYFLGRFIDFRFGHNYGQAISVSGHQETSENIQYNTLNAAAEPNLPHIVEALLLTCTQDAPHAQRKTPLMISAQKGLTGVTRLLLDRSVEKDAKDNSQRTALHYAADYASGGEAIVRLLVDQGVDKTIRDSNSEKALHLAVKKWWVTPLQRLLS